MKNQALHMAMASVVLAVFAMLGSGLLAFTADATRARIADNQRQALLQNLHAVVPPARIDNDLFNDTVQVNDPDLLGSKADVTVYRGRLEGQPSVIALTTVAGDGYSGRILILIGIDRGGTITGVRVLDHHETPGLGDYIDLQKSDWVLGFDGRSLADPGTPQGWRVERDGGQFSQFTGATITPRAVVKAVYKTLLFVNDRRELLFPSTRPIATVPESATATDAHPPPGAAPSSPGTEQAVDE